MVFSWVAWVRQDEFRGSEQREVNLRPGSLVLLARSRICSPVAGDESRVESYVGSFISKQPENRITFSSKQANRRSTHLPLTLPNPTLFVGVSCVSNAGLCFCGVCLTQVSKVSKELQRISRMKMSPCITGETKMAAVSWVLAWDLTSHGATGSTLPPHKGAQNLPYFSLSNRRISPVTFTTRAVAALWRHIMRYCDAKYCNYGYYYSHLLFWLENERLISFYDWNVMTLVTVLPCWAAVCVRAWVHVGTRINHLIWDFTEELLGHWWW